MAMITLNIYSAEDKSVIEKTYETDGYDLMLGTVEDFMEIIDVDKLDDNMELFKMVMAGYGQLKPLIKDVFPGLTDDEYKRIKVNDLVNTIFQLGTAVIESIAHLNSQGN